MTKPLSIMISTALLISLLSVAAATVTTTTITTTTITEENSLIINSECVKVDVTKINHCKMYLTPDPSNGQSIHLPECCGQLKEVETKCRCMGIKEVLWMLKNQRSESGKALWKSREVEQMEQDAQDLPRKCNIKLKEPCIIVQAMATM